MGSGLLVWVRPVGVVIVSSPVSWLSWKSQPSTSLSRWWYRHRQQRLRSAVVPFLPRPKSRLWSASQRCAGSSAAGHAAFSVPGADEVVEGGGGFVSGAADVEYRSGDRVAGDFAPHAVRISHDVPGDLAGELGRPRGEVPV